MLDHLECTNGGALHIRHDQVHGIPTGQGTSAGAEPRLIVRLSPEEARTVRRTSETPGAVFCETDAGAIDALNAFRPAGIVWELSRRMPWRHDPLPMPVVTACRTVPLLLRAEVNGPIFRQVLDVVPRVLDVRVSLCGFDDLSRAMDLMTMPDEREADQVIVSRLAPVVPPFAREVVMMAAFASKRRTTVSTLARLCACSVGTLRYRLETVGAPPPREILGRMTALHTAWRRGVLGWSVKRTAHEAGYEVPAALDRYVREHAGVRLSAMREPDCFPRLLDDFARQFAA